MNKLLISFAFISITSIASSQSIENAIPIDSIAKWELKIVQQPLGLDYSQAVEFVAAFKSRLESLDSLQAADLNISKRKILIKDINKSFQTQLKRTFSKDQLKMYKDEQQKQRSVFIERMNAKKIKVDEVGEDE